MKRLRAQATKPSDSTKVEIKDGTVGIADGNITSSQSKITEVMLPSSLKYIGKDNFNGMKNLTSIEIPASLVSIGDTAFSWCSSVTSLYIPASVNHIGDSAFNQMNSVTLYMEIEEKDIPSGWDENWNDTYGKVLEIVWGASRAA